MQIEVESHVDRGVDLGEERSCEIQSYSSSCPSEDQDDRFSNSSTSDSDTHLATIKVEIDPLDLDFEDDVENDESFLWTDVDPLFEYLDNDGHPVPVVNIASEPSPSSPNPTPIDQSYEDDDIDMVIDPQRLYISEDHLQTDENGLSGLESANQSNGNATSPCQHCGLTFKSSEELKKHHWLHPHSISSQIDDSETRKFKCTDCNASYKCNRSLRNHRRLHDKMTSGAAGVCRLCHHVTNSYWDLSMHFLQCHTGETPLPCSLCALGFWNSDNLSRHRKKCAKIQRPRRGAQLLTSTRRREPTLDQSPYKCARCDESFTSMNLKLSHAWKTHPDLDSSRLKLHPCSLCLNYYFRAPALRAHVKKEHHGEKLSFGCQICIIAFSTIQKHARHCKTVHHTALKSYRTDLLETLDYKHLCIGCGTRFQTSNSVKEHQKTGKLEKCRYIYYWDVLELPDLKCPDCSRQCMSLSDLKLHHITKHDMVVNPVENPQPPRRRKQTLVLRNFDPGQIRCLKKTLKL